MHQVFRSHSQKNRIANTAAMVTLICMNFFHAPASFAQANEQLEGNQVDFSYEATADLENDQMVLTFAAISEAKSSAEVSKQINQKMQFAKNALENAKVESIQTSNYSVSPVYNAKHEISHWRGRQTLTIVANTEHNLDRALQELQKHLAFQNMQFTLSKATRKKAEESLLLQAIEGYQQKAEVIAKGFGKQSYQLLKTSIQPSYAAPVARYQTMEVRAVAASSPAVYQEQGESTVRVQIRGTLLLKP